MNVLSLFDGKSGGQIALNRGGHKITNYYASEVNTDAIAVAMDNYPNTIQIGDVRNLKYCEGKLFTDNGVFEVGKIDLLIGGSPCQNLSFAGKRKGLTTKEGVEITDLETYLLLKSEDFQFEGQSYLFWEFVRLMREIKPLNFLLENVKMVKYWKDVFDEVMKVKGELINSSNFSAQNRPRYYWTNLKIDEYIDSRIVIEDIIEKEASLDLHVNIEGKEGIFTNNYYQYDLSGKNNGSQDQRGYYQTGKCGTLDRGCSNKHKLFIDKNTVRKFTRKELERLQTVPDNYTKKVSKNKAGEMLGNGWNIDTIVHILKNLKQ